MLVLESRFNPLFVVLSVIVAIFASYVALDLANSVHQAKGRMRSVWLICGALAMGIGIWSMHFVGMLAFTMSGVPMAYDVPLVLLSIVIAVMETLFNPFHRGPGDQIHNKRGWGLGLTIVKGVADAHGGSVRVESGGGWTRFEIQVPAS